MALLDGDEVARANLEKAHALMRAIVDAAPTRPPPPGAVRQSQVHSLCFLGA